VETQCADAHGSDDAPPSNCAVPLRLELRALASSPSPAPAAAVPPAVGDEARAAAATRQAVAPCYREALQKNPRFEGTLTLIASVGPDGSVESISARHDVSGEAARCAIDAVSHVTFPRRQVEAGRPRLFVVPLVFRGSRTR
jgi:hypothetical protein